MLSCAFWRKTAKITLILLTVSALIASEAEAKSRTRPRRSGPPKRHKVLPVDRGALYSDIVIEARTGRILRATNADSLRHPASLTKMMTLYITFQALEAGKLSLDQRLPVSAHAAAQSPSKLGLKRGQSIRAKDAIMGVVTKSANDAAAVLAEALGGSEERFAQVMTRQAKSLGMKKTKFYNSSGLPHPYQVSTARDMAMLAHALIYHYPQYYAWFGRESFTYAGKKHNNHNHLMERYDGMDGIKTGYVRASGFNLVASAVRENTRLIGAVFGGRSTASRDNQMAAILDQGFANAYAGMEPHIYQVRAGSEDSDYEDGSPDTAEAQGDGEDMEDSRYIALPTKVASVFTSSRVPSFDEGASAPAGTWGIQIGAYSEAVAGQRALAVMARNMPQLLGRTDQILQKVSASDGNVIYRARFMGMEEKTARSICAYLVKHGQGCMAVMPGTPTPSFVN